MTVLGIAPMARRTVAQGGALGLMPSALQRQELITSGVHAGTELH
jgi:hypothetical protein